MTLPADMLRLGSEVQREYEWVKKNLGTNGDGLVEIETVQRFWQTAPEITPGVREVITARMCITY